MTEYEELGIVRERTEGQYYIMKKQPGKNVGDLDWAISIAAYMGGLTTDIKNWKLSEEFVHGLQYKVHWRDVDTEYSDFFKDIVSKLEKNLEYWIMFSQYMGNLN